MIKFTTIVVFAVYLFAGIGFVNEVICYGCNGHEAEDSNHATNNHAQDTHCSSCVDISVAAGHDDHFRGLSQLDLISSAAIVQESQISEIPDYTYVPSVNADRSDQYKTTLVLSTVVIIT